MKKLATAVAALAALAGSSLFLHAQMMEKVAADKASATPPAKPAAAGKTAKAASAAQTEEYSKRYGEIFTSSSEPSHPLKLSMPFPDVGLLKMPSGQEIAMRDKLERLTTLSDEEIRQELASWPAYSKMSLADEGAMLMRIQMFKDQRNRVAQERAHALGLIGLKPDQMAKFTTEYWQKRLQMDRELMKQFQPAYAAREAQLQEQLFREFSTPGQPVPPPPAVAKTKPASAAKAPPAAAAKPAATKPAPVKLTDTNKPGSTPPAPAQAMH